MKKIILSLFILLTMSTSLQAQSGRFTNSVRTQQQLEKIDAVVDNIPIFRERLSIKHTMLGPVHCEDAFTNSKDALLRALRVSAYKLNANAISEFQCKKIAKSILQSCSGFAVFIEDDTLKAYLNDNTTH